jgi:hypothetical protein
LIYKFSQLPFHFEEEESKEDILESEEKEPITMCFDLGLPSLIWFMICEHLDMKDMVNITSLCISSFLLFKDCPIKVRIQLNPDSRKWLQRSNIVVQSCKNIRIQEASDHPIMNICFSNSNHLVVTSENCTFSVWDVKTFEMIGGVEALSSVVNALCALPEPTHVVSNILNCSLIQELLQNF